MKNDISQQKAVTVLRILYPVWMVFGMFSLFYVPSVIIVPNDAPATAGNIIANEFLFRAGIIGDLITQLIFIFVAVFLYKLFETVDKNQSLLMVILALVSVPIAMLNALNNVAALLSLKNNEQMLFFLDLNAQGVNIVSIFWGLWLFPLGYLIYKSEFFPKIIGILVIAGGFGYILNSFIKLLLPGFEIILSIFEIMTFGEVVFVVWLLFKGAKIPKTD